MGVPDLNHNGRELDRLSGVVGPRFEPNAQLGFGFLGAI